MPLRGEILNFGPLSIKQYRHGALRAGLPVMWAFRSRDILHSGRRKWLNTFKGIGKKSTVRIEPAPGHWLKSHGTFSPSL